MMMMPVSVRSSDTDPRVYPRRIQMYHVGTYPTKHVVSESTVLADGERRNHLRGLNPRRRWLENVSESRITVHNNKRYRAGLDRDQWQFERRGAINVPSDHLLCHATLRYGHRRACIQLNSFIGRVEPVVRSHSTSCCHYGYTQVDTGRPGAEGRTR